MLTLPAGVILVSVKFGSGPGHRRVGRTHWRRWCPLHPGQATAMAQHPKLSCRVIISIDMIGSIKLDRSPPRANFRCYTLRQSFNRNMEIALPCIALSCPAWDSTCCVAFLVTLRTYEQTERQLDGVMNAGDSARSTWHACQCHHGGGSVDMVILVRWNRALRTKIGRSWKTTSIYSNHGIVQTLALVSQ